MNLLLGFIIGITIIVIVGGILLLVSNKSQKEEEIVTSSSEVSPPVKLSDTNKQLKKYKIIKEDGSEEFIISEKSIEELRRELNK